jgi:DNA modification methylase
MRREVIGNATLYLGDCREWMAGVPECFQVDAVITDPPYGLDFEYGTYVDTRENLKSLIDGFMPLARGIAERVVVMPGITQVHLYPPPEWIMAIHWNTTGSFGKYGYTQWMPVLVYGADLPGFGNVNGGVMKTDCFPVSGGAGVGFMRDGEKEAHPCPKPENLMRKLVGRLSPVSGVVLDPFMGSGTTGVAAVAMGRRFVGIELEPKFFDQACRRIEDAQRQARMFG